MVRRRPIPTWTPREWVPFNDAFTPIMASAGSPALAEHDLYQDLRSGRLSSALRQILLDGKDKVRFLSPSDWEQWTLRWQNAHNSFGFATIALIVIDKDGKPVEGHFYVRRADLGKHYGTLTPTAAAGSPRAADDDEPTRRKPGKKIKKGWKLTAAVELDGFIKEKERRPSGPELSERVDKKLKYYPDESDVRELMRFLLDDE